MRIKLIEDLPMASSAELYQISWVIDQLLADPRRIVQARAELHTGQQVQYLHWDDGKMRAGRVVAMKDRRVTVFDEASRSHLTLPYVTCPLPAVPTQWKRSPIIRRMTDMRKSRFTEEQIIGFIKQAEAGLPIKELCRKGGFSDATFYKWRAKYGGMDVPDARRLRELEGENAKLKKLLAEAHLDIHALNTAFGVKR